jgi:hypothetical protein
MFQPHTTAQPPIYEAQPAAYQAQTPPPQAPALDPMTARLAHLQQLGQLKAQGILSEAEFQEQKKLILDA